MSHHTGAHAGEHLVVDPAFAQAMNAEHLFDACMAITGETVRDVSQRRTVRFTLAGERYYAKLHFGVGWREIAKNLLHGRRPVLGAGDEWRAIRRVTQLGITTTHAVAYGCRGRNPATMQSFLITRDIGPSVSLETLCETAAKQGIDDTCKRWLIGQVAAITRTLHANGINHRDLYLCHFELLREALPPRLALLDLHRAQLRERVPRRWIVKDLAGLLFSALDGPLTQRDALRFVRAYSDDRLAITLRRDARLWRQVWRRAMRMYHAHWHRPPQAVLARHASFKGPRDEP